MTADLFFLPQFYIPSFALMVMLNYCLLKDIVDDHSFTSTWFYLFI